MNTKLLGRWGEAQAAEYLKRKGYQLLAMGYRTRYGELDIVAKQKELIVFAEVKLRRNAAFASARDHVTAAKREKLRITAGMWLSRENCELPCRFDVIEIYAPQGVETENPTINHIEDAFQ